MRFFLENSFPGDTEGRAAWLPSSVPSEAVAIKLPFVILTVSFRTGTQELLTHWETSRLATGSFLPSHFPALSNAKSRLLQGGVKDVSLH